MKKIIAFLFIIAGMLAVTSCQKSVEIQKTAVVVPVATKVYFPTTMGGNMLKVFVNNIQKVSIINETDNEINIAVNSGDYISYEALAPYLINGKITITGIKSSGVSDVILSKNVYAEMMPPRQIYSGNFVASNPIYVNYKISFVEQ
jgi:hypothetical protein